MRQLITYAPLFGEPSASPFCTKAMCLLEMAGVDWQPDYTADPRKMPNQKLPVLRENGRLIADSSAIRTHLEQSAGIDFDLGLSPTQRAQSHALIRMAEEHLYFAIVCDRWLDEANWAVIRHAYFSAIPRLIRGPITRKIRTEARAALIGQGMARHDEAARLDRVRQDIVAIRDMLDGQAFLFGDRPSAADASIGPMLAAASATPCPTPLRDMLRDDADLQAYMARVRAAIYPSAAKALRAA